MNFNKILSKAMSARQFGDTLSAWFGGTAIKRYINKFIGRKIVSKLFIRKMPWE